MTFVSVTQSFNTTTSMGRTDAEYPAQLAQFEREVIGERIRDKFGNVTGTERWMGWACRWVPTSTIASSWAMRLEAATVRRIFGGFAEIRSGTKLTKVLRSEGVTTKRGRPIDKGDIYKLLNNRTYVGDVVHKGNVYPGEHQGGRLTGVVGPRAPGSAGKSAGTCQQEPCAKSPALLRGLIFGADGRAMSPTHTRRRGRLYRYYVRQSVLKGDDADNVMRRVSAAEVEAAVVGQVVTLLRRPEIVVATWLAARGELPDLTEDQTREALEQLDPLWDQLFPAEQARIVRCWSSGSRSDPPGRTSVSVLPA